MTEADIVERYGWTYDELDNADVDRVYRGYALQNIRERTGRIKAWLTSGGKVQLTEDDLQFYQRILEAKKNSDSE